MWIIIAGISERSADGDCTLFETRIDNEQSGSSRECIYTEKANENFLEPTHENDNVAANFSIPGRTSGEQCIYAVLRQKFKIIAIKVD